MELNEFSIGGWFATGPHLFKCTDIGSRTVVALRIDEVEIVTYDTATGVETRRIADLRDTGENWLNGPPYGVAELVFDEDDVQACSVVTDPIAWRPDVDAVGGEMVTDGSNHWTVDDPTGPIGRARKAEGVDLIATLEDEYSLPSRAGGPLSTSLEWNEIKRRLTGRDPFADALDSLDRGEGMTTDELRKRLKEREDAERARDKLLASLARHIVEGIPRGLAVADETIAWVKTCHQLHDGGVRFSELAHAIEETARC